MKFIFDLDGTITLKETLPLISSHFNVDKQISELTDDTIKGNIPFIESFIRRVQILGDLPVSEINDLLAGVPLSEKLLQFISENSDDCIITTGNLNGWVDKLLGKIGCKAYTSDGIIENNKVKKLTNILKKRILSGNIRHWARLSFLLVMEIMIQKQCEKLIFPLPVVLFIIPHKVFSL